MWPFRSRHSAPTPDAPTPAAPGKEAAPAQPQYVARNERIQHIPGVKIDIKTKLPDGGKTRVAHYARIGSPSLGRVRLGSRNLALHHEPEADGRERAFGEIAAGEGFPAFNGEAEEGASTDWNIPLQDGEAVVTILITREDVPA